MVSEQRTKSDNPCCTQAHHTPPLIYVITRYGPTWETWCAEFVCPLRWNKGLLLSRTSVGSASSCGMLSVKVPVQHDLCHLVFVNHSHVIWMQMQQFCCISCCDAQCIFYASQRGDFHANFTIIVPISSRFLHSTHVFSMLCFCLLWNLFPQISSCTL